MLIVPYVMAAVAALTGYPSRVHCGLAAAFAVIVSGIGVWIAALEPLHAQFAGLVLLFAVAVQVVVAGVGLGLLAILWLVARKRRLC
jgi:hypothetical protein